MASTSYLSPTATGETYNDWFPAENVYSSNNQWAFVDPLGYVDQDYYNFSVSIPESSTIDGIEVQIEGVCGLGETGTINVRLSPNGGTSWTGWDGNQTFTDAEGYKTYGGSTDAWGRIWSVSEFSNSNFRVHAQCTSADGYYFLVDHLLNTCTFFLLPLL